MLRTATAALAAVLTLGGLSTATASADVVESTIQLAFYHPHAPTVAPDQAHVLFADVNATRARLGLSVLVEDARLDRLAMAKAEDMADRHYFGHTDPDGVTFEDRIRESGFRFSFAAENIAFDEDAAHANQAFLHSAGHYQNIVDPQDRRMGTAVVAAGDGELFFVEEFAD